jgi:hypothetical protein
MIGGIAGDAGKGAAIGAVVGVTASVVQKGQKVSVSSETMLEFISSASHHCRRCLNRSLQSRGSEEHSKLQVLPYQKNIVRSRQNENKQARRPRGSDGEGAIRFDSRSFRRVSSNALATYPNVAQILKITRMRTTYTNSSL